MAEKLVEHQLFGECPAVDGQEPVVGPRTQLIDCPGNKLLASAGVAGYQHIAVHLGHLGDIVLEPQNGVVLADELGYAFLGSYLTTQVEDLAAEQGFLQGPGDQVA
ncbi:hypothetical protein GF1_10700 [Desulfolithobacter dissulfuricans]|uniref:Uncharacterized protein n=1 Tax=Desulfolithobacter dissulfuricans TaxID=2795293 RepID=A0A915U0G3_9BACT|nr:hypothetical protein GF1_10700 [Desulfolithobacter dissulfuricans]